MFLLLTIIEFLLGSLFHFVYELYPRFLTALFFPINESIFEHLKLILYPMLLVGVIYVCIKKEINDYTLTAILMSILIGMLCVVFIFYFGRYGLGIENEYANIILLFISQWIGNMLAYILLKRRFVLYRPILWISMCIIFMTFFSLYPPAIPLFQV